MYTLTDRSGWLREDNIFVVFRASLVVLVYISVTCLSWQLSWLEIKRRILRKAVNILHRQQRLAEETASWLEVSGGAGTSSSIVSHHYRLISNCILWYIPARCMRLRTYPIFSYSSVKSNLKGSICFKTSKTSFTTAQITSMLLISIPM